MPDPLVTTTFTMYGARAAIADGLTHIEEQVKAIELAVVENPGLTFDLAKAIVESTCKTILYERKIAFGANDDLPRLFKTLTKALPLLPNAASNEVEAHNSLNRILNGLHTALQGVCELRNACGFASHGSDGPRPPMESVQALLVAQSADAIVGFLHRVHYQDSMVDKGRKLEYEGNVDFNDFVDDANEMVRIFELEYRPSEVLFKVDLEAYRDRLSDYKPHEDDEAEAAGKVVGVAS